MGKIFEKKREKCVEKLCIECERKLEIYSKRMTIKRAKNKRR